MNYVSRVADSLLSRSGYVSVLGPEIYSTIAEWEKKEIPLRIVMNSIDEVCGDNVEANGKLESIDKFQAVVNKNFRNWLVDSTAQKAVGA